MKFDGEVVDGGLEGPQSTTAPPWFDDVVGNPWIILMSAGTLRSARKLQERLGLGADVRWDASASKGLLTGLTRLAGAIDMAHTRVVALIDAHWFSDDALSQWHRQHPQWPIVIVARDDGPSTLKTMTACISRGCVSSGGTEAEVAQAVHAVARGEIWIAASIVPYLYASMLAHASAVVEVQADANPSLHSAEPHAFLIQALTRREVAAIELARTGQTNKEIARALGISDNTVKKHLAHAFDKLGIHRRRQLFGTKGTER